MATRSRVAEYRAAAGLTQQRLAERADVSISYLAQLERERSVPTIEVARRIASALGATVDDLWPMPVEEAV